MVTPAPASDALAVPRLRILRQARDDFFINGYTGFTMDQLATELGMSKKTLYRHFAGKDEIIGAVIQDLGDELRADAEGILANPNLNFARKLHGFVGCVMERLARLEPRTLREFRPRVYASFAFD